MRQRFEKFVDRSGECHLWTGARVSSGDNQYGGFQIGARCERAHRVAWALARGDIPAGLHVLHNCNVKLCVNPAHLRLGTNQDNMNDVVLLGYHSNQKLVVENVEDIRANCDGTPASFRHFAEKYSVNYSTVRDIYIKATWRVLLPENEVVALEAKDAERARRPKKRTVRDLSCEQKQRIIAHSKSGMPQREIAILYGVSHHTVASIIQRVNTQL